MDSAYVYMIFFLVFCIAVFIGFMFWLFKTIREEVQRNLDAHEGDQAAQEEIRKKLIKALYPPRFNRD
jgi:Na+/melibiose symporter-like transporter